MVEVEVDQQAWCLHEKVFKVPSRSHSGFASYPRIFRLEGTGRIKEIAPKSNALAQYLISIHM